MPDETNETVDETIDDSSTLDKAIKGAEQIVEETFKLDDDEEETEEKEPKDDKKKDDKKDGDEEEEEEEEEEELTPEQKIHAKNIFKLLSNPQTATNTLKTLATQAGLEIKDAETKQEKREAKKAVRDIVKEKLGDNYPHLADKLGEMLEGLLSDAVKESTKDITARLNAAEEKTNLNATKAAHESVIKEYVDVPAKVLREVLRIQQEDGMAPGPNSKPDVFFRGLVRMASENLGYTLVKRTSANQAPEKKEVKKKSPLDEIAAKSRSGSGIKDGIKTTQVKNVGDAIALAVDQVTASMKK